MKNLLFGLLALMLTTLVLLGLLEGGAWLLNKQQITPPVTEWQFRARQPAPYQNAPYFSAAFVEESRKAPGGWSTHEGTSLVIPNDFRGTFINVQNHLRVTTNQPESATHTVFMLGGSTMYSGEVPDAFTIPSQLQARLNEKAPGQWRVENWGASTVIAAQQLERLRQAPIKPGDVVVFYDGVNDAVQGVFFNNPQGWMVQSNRDKLKHLGWYAYVVRAQLWLRDHSALGALLLPAPDNAVPEHLNNPDIVQQIASETMIHYQEALLDAATYVQDRGATFIHVLQPNLFTKQEWTPYEAALAGNTMLVQAGLEQAVKATYPALQSTLDNMQADGTLTTLDFTHVLDNTPDAYLDFCHVSGVANGVIAAELAPLIK